MKKLLLSVDKVNALRKNEGIIFSGFRFSCAAKLHGQKICKERKILPESQAILQNFSPRGVHAAATDCIFSHPSCKCFNMPLFVNGLRQLEKAAFLFAVCSLCGTCLTVCYCACYNAYRAFMATILKALECLEQGMAFYDH